MTGAVASLTGSEAHMAVMIGELYDALRAAGVDPQLARAAAEAVYRDCGHGRQARGLPWLTLLQILLAVALLLNALILAKVW